MWACVNQALCIEKIGIPCVQDEMFGIGVHGGRKDVADLQGLKVLACTDLAQGDCVCDEFSTPSIE